MATALKLRSDIKKLKKAIETKGISAPIKQKLKTQLEKAENELSTLNSTGKAPKKSSVASTKTALTSLQKLVNRKKFSVYKGKGVDLKKDAGEGAMATGRRVSKGLKSNQFGEKSSNKGNVYYEYRPNRLDVKQPKKNQKYPKLEDGGMMAEGGYVAVSEKDGYWYIISKPTSKEKAQKMIDLGVPKGEVGKVVTVNEAKSHKKVIGKEYLASGGMMAMGGEVKVGDILTAKTGVKLKVVEYDPKFGGRVRVERMDEYSTGKPSQFMSLSRFKMADGGEVNVDEIKRKMYLLFEGYLGNFISEEELISALSRVLGKKRWFRYYRDDTGVNDINSVKRHLSQRVNKDFEKEQMQIAIDEKGLRVYDFKGNEMMADGGMMAKGGELKVGDKVELLNGMNARIISLSDSGRGGGRYYVVETDERYGKDRMTIPKEQVKKLASGGMMADGGYVVINKGGDRYDGGLFYQIKKGDEVVKQGLIDGEGMVEFEGKKYDGLKSLAEGINAEIKIEEMKHGGMMAEGGEIKKGDYVIVDNPHWKAALGNDKPVRRKVKMVLDEVVVFNDGSTSSLKYIKKMEDGGVISKTHKID